MSELQHLVSCCWVLGSKVTNLVGILVMAIFYDLVNLVPHFLTAIQMKVVFIVLSYVGSGIINKLQRVYALPK